MWLRGVPGGKGRGMFKTIGQSTSGLDIGHRNVSSVKNSGKMSHRTKEERSPVKRVEDLVCPE